MRPNTSYCAQLLSSVAGMLKLVGVQSVGVPLVFGPDKRISVPMR